MGSVCKCVNKSLRSLLQGALRHVGHEPTGDGLKDVVEHIGHQHPKGNLRQARQVFVADEAIDGDAHQVRADQAQHRINHDEDADQSQYHAEGLEIRHQTSQRRARILRLFNPARLGRSVLHRRAKTTL